MVVFFCARQSLYNPRIWDYYYIGFGTVRAAITRWQLWRDSRFQVYRRFYNVLAKPEGSTLVQKETFSEYHKDWRSRADAPYILFEDDDRLSHFNLRNPLQVATYDGVRCPEKWDSGSSPLTVRLEGLLFTERGISRRLRSSPTGYGHAPINLTRKANTVRPGRDMSELRQALWELSELIADSQAA
jgi:hypothetical protein